MEESNWEPGDETDGDEEFEDEDESSCEDEIDNKNVIQSSTSIYMRQITTFLQSHKEVNTANALALNKEMQHKLRTVRDILLAFLAVIKECYERTEKILTTKFTSRGSGVGIQGAYLRGGTFYLKGNMFFKDINCRNCPNNPDYEHRSKQLNEMFPMDFELRARHVWTIQDKWRIVQGVKEQVLQHLADEQNPKSKLNLELNLNDEKLVNLLEKVNSNFRIDWLQISGHNVRSRHSATSCKAMWYLYLHPKLKHAGWSSEEKQRLLEAAIKNNYRNWKAIATSVGNRSEYQCFIQYQTTVCYMETNRFERWKKEDDRELLAQIEKYTINGVINWNAVGEQFPNKQKRALQARYHYSIHPEISHAPFTPEEDLILLASVKEYNGKFSLFPRTLFPNRSVIQLRARYQNTLKDRNKLQPWSVEDDHKLLKFVDDNGNAAWAKCAELLGNHSRTSCRTRYLTIQKFFVKNPTKKIEDLPRKKIINLDSQITPENWMEKLNELHENPNANFKTEYNKARERPSKIESPVKPKEQNLMEVNKTEINEEDTEDIKAKENIINEKIVKKRKEKAIDKSLVPVVARRRPNKIYRNTLRVNERCIYEYFKYAYNFQLGLNRGTQMPDTYSSMEIVANALHFRLASDDIIDNKAVAALNIQLPPSWSTVMGFRALCIQSTTVEDSVPIERSALETCSYYVAVQKFRQRLRTLFYECALLSRLHPDTIRPLTVPVFAEPSHEDMKTVEETRDDASHNMSEDEELQFEYTNPSFLSPYDVPENGKLSNDTKYMPEDDNDAHAFSQKRKSSSYIIYPESTKRKRSDKDDCEYLTIKIEKADMDMETDY